MSARLGDLFWFDIDGIEVDHEKARAGLEGRGFDPSVLLSRADVTAFREALLDIESEGEVWFIEAKSTRSWLVMNAVEPVVEGKEAGTHRVLAHVKYRRTDGAVGCGDEDLLRKIRAATVSNRGKVGARSVKNAALAAIARGGEVCPMRSRGSVYFIPHGAGPRLREVKTWFSLSVSQGGLASLPIVDDPASRRAVLAAFRRHFARMARRTSEALRRHDNDKPVPRNRWAVLDRDLGRLEATVDLYAEILGEDGFAGVRKRMREVLDLGAKIAAVERKEDPLKKANRQRHERKVERKIAFAAYVEDRKRYWSEQYERGGISHSIR